MAYYRNKATNCYVTKALPKPIIKEVYNQSKVLVKINYIEYSEYSPIYNFSYPIEMLLNKPC